MSAVGVYIGCTYTEVYAEVYREMHVEVYGEVYGYTPVGSMRGTRIGKCTWYAGIRLMEVYGIYADGVARGIRWWRYRGIRWWIYTGVIGGMWGICRGWCTGIRR